MRGLASTGSALVPTDVHVLLEHSNRGKKSLGPRPHHARRPRHPLQARRHGRRLPHQQAAERARRSCTSTSTTSGPTTRTSSTCAAPARASGAPTPTRARYDSLAFWARAGVAARRPAPRVRPDPGPPAPGFGDSIGAMTIAGGIMGALFHRERTGEATVVDVSLLGTGHVGHGPGHRPVARARQAVGAAAGAPMLRNPLVADLHDQRRPGPALTCLQGCQVLADAVRVDRPSRAGHRPALRRPRSRSWRTTTTAAEILTEVFARRPLDEWRERLEPFIGQWAVVQDTLEAATIRSRSPTATCRTARPPTARRSSWSRRRSSTTSSRPPPRPRARVQRARRRDPRGARPRLGHHGRPQGPWRRRLRAAAWRARSARRDRQALPAAHGGRPGLLGVVPIDLPLGEALQHLVEGHPSLEAGERGAEAEVDAVAERQVVVDPAVDVERVASGNLRSSRLPDRSAST